MAIIFLVIIYNGKEMYLYMLPCAVGEQAGKFSECARKVRLQIPTHIQGQRAIF